MPATTPTTEPWSARGHRRPRRAMLLAALATAATGLQAARPLITDDARIVDASACQVESWVHRHRDTTELWALPGCNPTGNLELTLGGGRTRTSADGWQTTSLVLQGKTLFQPLTPGGWGWGLALGGSSNPSTGARDVYTYVPVSFSLRDDQTFVHLNLGAKREGLAHRKQFTWGLGLEQPLSEQLGLIGEVFSQDKGRPFAQLGGRVWLVRDRVQLDATVGNRLASGSQERWVSIGLRLLSPPFLP